jgi:hypothetical protein
MMELSFVFGGSTMYQLQHHGANVGYLDVDVLVFTGFASFEEAERRAMRGISPCSVLPALDWRPTAIFRACLL